MYAERQSVALVTVADGSVTAYSTAVTGRVMGLRYVKTDFDNGVTITVTLEATGETICVITSNSSVTVYPRVQVHDETGAGATLDGTRKMREPVLAVGDRLKFVVAAGGSVKTGAIIVIVG